MSNTNNKSSSPSLFSGNQQLGNNQDTQIGSKFQNRQNEFKVEEENLSKVKESTMAKELSLGENKRRKIFDQKRIHNKINIDTSESLFNKLNISKDDYNKLSSEEIQPNDFTKIINLFKSQNPSDKFKGLIGIRKLLSIEPNPPIQEIIDNNIIPELIKLLDSPFNEFIYESLWALTNVSYGDEKQVNTILTHDGLNKIMNLLDSKIEELKKQAIWLLANMTVTSVNIRDLFVGQKVFEKLLIIITSTDNIDYISLGIWAVSNFFRFKSPKLEYDYCYKALKVISKVMINYDIKDKSKIDEEMLISTCLIISYITKYYGQLIQEIIDSGLLNKIIAFLDLENPKIIISCLRIMGNITLGNANQNQKLLELGILDKLKYYLYFQSQNIRKESAYILSNLAAGTQKQIETLIDNNFLQILYKTFQKDNPPVKKEALFAIANLTGIESDVYMEKLIKDGILIILSECIKSKDDKFIIICLEALSNVLAFGKKKGMLPLFIKEIEKIGLVDILENLQNHTNEIVYDKVLQILDNYFEVENI